MCGICGKIYFDHSRAVNKSELKGMTDLLVHRGPDDEGFYINRNIGLGFRRLSIIDLTTGHQPLTNEDETIWIVFNGEIYNFLDLRRDLMKKGHTFRTKTDTEVIVHLYEEYGKDCVQYLRGMFAFAIWDEKNRKVFCARDRFGIKPFFYYYDDEQFIFGSELKLILNSNDVKQEIDFLSLDSYFAYGYTTGRKTIFKNIQKLEPANILELSLLDRKIDISKYWGIIFEPDYSKSEEQWCEEIEECLSESVKMHLISDVPLGAFLSGGIDSSSVVALMSKHSSMPVKTFSIGFKEKRYYELSFAREIAKKYQTEHHEKIIQPDSIALLPILVQAYDEPFAESSAIPTYYISKFAREFVTVVLSGDGGDELFAGYDSYLKLNSFYKYNITSNAFNKVFWGNIYKMIPSKVKGKGITYFLSKEPETLGAYFSVITQPERTKLYKPEIWEQIKKMPAESYKEAIITNSLSEDFVSKMQELDVRTYLVDDILTKVDRASMQNSLEVRVPILDHKVAELSFRIPSRLKLKNRKKKYIFKKAMSKYLTPNVINHKKQGFVVPLNMWFKSDLKTYVHDRLNTKNSFISRYLDTKIVIKMINDHNTGMRDLNQKIWALLFLDAWLEHKKK